jgi:Tfp pilus assembly protein PilE
MNKLADARKYAALVKKWRRQSAAKVLLPTPVRLEEFYQTEKLFDAAHWKNDVTHFHFTEQFKFLFRWCETFSSRTSSIRAQPLSGLSAARSKRTPRWQPRGYDTQSFRPLVQEEEVS